MIANFVKEQVNTFIIDLYNKTLEEEINLYLSEYNTMRNGYYERFLETIYGRLKLVIPRTRDNKYFPSFLTKWQRQDDSFLLRLLSILKTERTINDCSKEIDKDYNIKYSDSFLRKLRDKKLNARKDFENKKIDKEYEAIFFDGTYLNFKKKKICLMIIIGLKKDKSKAVLDFEFAENENKKSYENMLLNLKKRGLKNAKIFCSDGFLNVDDLICKIFPNSKAQKCLIHFKKNIRNLYKIGIDSNLTKDFLEDFDSLVYNQEIDFKKSVSLLDNLIKKHSLFCKMGNLTKYDLRMLINHKIIENKSLWKSARTTNIVEGFNHQFKRWMGYREQFRSLKNLIEFTASFCLQFATQKCQNS